MEWDLLRAALTLTLGGLLLAAGIEDARTREIADGKSIAIAALAPAWWWANGASLWPGVGVQVAVSLLVFALFAWAFARGMMGGGDVKLIAALSLWLPPLQLLGMLTVMAIAGGAVTVAMLVERGVRRSSESPPVEVPYGVAIAIAGLLALREPILNQFG